PPCYASFHPDSPACKIEVPERLTVSHTALQEEGLAERCVSVPIRQATDAEILLAHSEEYLEAVKKTPYMSLDELRTFTQQYGDVYFHPNIYHCAKLAIGAALQLVDSVMTGKVRNGMALVRPPGHHSQRSAANGFCVFNNVAIAAHYAKKQYGIKRVLIVDWDVHHGQGVQFAFEDDPSVLYFSWHRYEHQGFWPNLRESDYDSVGKEKGAGFNINVPWNKVGMENSDYLSVFFHVLLPIAYEGHMCATPDIFAHLTHLLKSLAGGKLCAVLEGGYNLTSLAQSVCQTVQTLLGDPAPQTSELNGPCESALESIQCVRSAHKPYWACLKHTASVPVITGPNSSDTAKTKISGFCVSEKGTANYLEKETYSYDMILLVRLPRFYGGDVCYFLPYFNAQHLLCTVYYYSQCVCFVCVPPQGCSDVAGLMQAVLCLLLPLAYEYDPGLVLLVRGPGSGVGKAAWAQITSLLQGLAQGHTLALIQEGEKEAVGTTAASLLGDPAPSLGPLGAPLPEDMEAMESLRQRLQTHWGLLQTAGEQMITASKETYSVTQMDNNILEKQNSY
uniref:Histone deacetylase 10 n=1 Tax=Salmo trutta TaxID=8032 RepID=A0A674AXC5_SALTR